MEPILSANSERDDSAKRTPASCNSTADRRVSAVPRPWVELSEIDTMAKRFEKHKIEALKSALEESEHLTKEKKIELVAATGLDVEQITS
ncbi:hypothetical protein DH2020_010539 [Rehmannia glutinosa]|uniref:Uncharacterized protein n=1 Tax=Rehmannia glutinosa TaxID=99300 RepID=A0ABR0XAZ6_REHGL